MEAFREYKADFVVAGRLRNLGNTCYINAVLQMLNSLESFKSDLESACSEVSAPTSENNVLFTLQAVLKQLYCNSSRAPVNPNQLRRVFANRFLEYSQEVRFQDLTSIHCLFASCSFAPELTSMTDSILGTRMHTSFW